VFSEVLKIWPIFNAAPRIFLKLLESKSAFFSFKAYFATPVFPFCDSFSYLYPTFCFIASAIVPPTRRAPSIPKCNALCVGDEGMYRS